MLRPRTLQLREICLFVVSKSRAIQKLERKVKSRKFKVGLLSVARQSPIDKLKAKRRPLPPHLIGRRQVRKSACFSESIHLPAYIYLH